MRSLCHPGGYARSPKPNQTVHKTACISTPRWVKGFFKSNPTGKNASHPVEEISIALLRSLSHTLSEQLYTPHVSTDSYVALPPKRCNLYRQDNSSTFLVGGRERLLGLFSKNCSSQKLHPSTCCSYQYRIACTQRIPTAVRLLYSDGGEVKEETLR